MAKGLIDTHSKWSSKPRFIGTCCLYKPPGEPEPITYRTNLIPVSTGDLKDVDIILNHTSLLEIITDNDKEEEKKEKEKRWSISRFAI